MASLDHIVTRSQKKLIRALRLLRNLTSVVLKAPFTVNGLYGITKKKYSG